jgi:anti-anti-sigma factor
VARAIRPDLSLIVDLAEVTFMDSAGVATLLSLAELVRAADGEFHLRRPPATVGRLLEITGLTDALPVADSPARHERESA